MRKAKISIKIVLRLLKDMGNGTYFRFAGKAKTQAVLGYSLGITQQIMPSPTFENKVYNLKLASQRISEYVIHPGQVFSFWHIIGNPDKGFKKGRSIINGQLCEEMGGGLCQVSGIIYHAALLGGLEILERHNHSMDIYNDETRFTPLGTDATVVYGYKDLRLRNNLCFPVQFSLVVMGNSISVVLRSEVKIREKALVFEMEDSGNEIVVTVTDEKGNLLNTSEYKTP
ncbi:VanW family protein [Flavobacterium sp.]|uniref:VanW family protein n=1 Tax=Flavobacterium sp. TaxID=239 RepID=UPI004033C963